MNAQTPKVDESPSGASYDHVIVIALLLRRLGGEAKIPREEVEDMLLRRDGATVVSHGDSAKEYFTLKVTL